jgi:hypothetical protein
MLILECSQGCYAVKIWPLAVRIVFDTTVTNILSTITVLFLILRLIRFLYKILFCREGNSADVFYIDYGETENIGEERKHLFQCGFKRR